MTDNHSLTRLDLRAYQTNALTYALDRDHATVCLPTGTGKTLVGCGWACRVLATPELDRVLVVEPSRFLVEQTAAYYRQHTTFGVSISKDLVEELDALTEQCVDLQTSRSEVVEAILTAYFQGDIEHKTQVRELIIRRRKGTL